MPDRDAPLRTALRVSAAVTFTCGFVPLTGWLLGERRLTNFWFGPERVGTSRVSAIILVALGVLGGVGGREAPSRRGLHAALGLLTAGAASATLLAWAQWSMPEVFGPPHDAGLLPGPLNATGLACACIATLAAVRGARYPQVALPAAVSLTVAIFACLQLVFSAMATPGGGSHQTALPTALGVFAAALSPLWMRRSEGIGWALTEPGATGVLSRRLLAASLAVPTTLGVVRALIHERGLLSVQVGIALFATGMSVALAVVSLWIVRAVTRIDAQQGAIEAALHRSEATFRASFEQNALGMARVHPEGHFLDVNAALCELLGLTRESLLRKRFQDITHPEDLDADLALLREVLAGKRERYSLEKRYLHHDGHEVSVLLGVGVVRTRDGEPDFFVASIQDVSALRAARDEMHRLGEMRRAILDAANLSIISTDPAGVVRSFNRGAERILGYTADEVTGRCTPGIFHDVDEVRDEALALSARLGREVPAGFEAFVALTRDGEVSEREWTYLHKGGARTPVFLSVTALRDARGGIEGFLGVASDITERRRHVQAIEGALREKEMLLNEVHHRVKNNLQVVTSLLRLAARRVDAAEARAVFAECQARIEVMARIHEQLYRLGHFGRVDFAAHLRELVALSRTAHAHLAPGLTVTVETDEVELDLDQAIPLGLIAHELVSNAFKHAFAHRATGRLAVTLREAEGRVCLQVADDGPGLHEDDPAAPRNGLGLRLVRTLCAQLRAELDLGAEGRGAVTVAFGRSEAPAALDPRVG